MANEKMKRGKIYDYDFPKPVGKVQVCKTRGINGERDEYLVNSDFLGFSIRNLPSSCGQWDVEELIGSEIYNKINGEICEAMSALGPRQRITLRAFGADDDRAGRSRFSIWMGDKQEASE